MPGISVFASGNLERDARDSSRGHIIVWGAYLIAALLLFGCTECAASAEASSLVSTGDDSDEMFSFDQDASASGECEISLRIVDGDGDAVDEGELWLGGLAAVDSRTVTVVQKGPFEISKGEVTLKEVAGGGYTIAALSDDLAAIAMLMVQENCARVPEELILEKARVVEGRALGPGGEGVSEALLEVRARSLDMRLPVEEDGSFRYTLPLDESLDLKAVAPGLSSSVSSLGRQEEPARPVMLRMTPSTSVRVNVRHADGRPASSVIISFSWRGNREGAVTGRKGTARFEQVPFELISVKIQYREMVMRGRLTFEDLAMAMTQEVVLELKMPPLGVVEGRVLEGDAPLSRGSVEATASEVTPWLSPKLEPSELVRGSERGRRRHPRVEARMSEAALQSNVESRVRVDSQGKFTMVLPEGRWELTVEKGARVEGIEVDVVADETLKGVDIDLGTKISVSGVVQLEDGSPLIAQRIECEPETDEVQEEEREGVDEAALLQASTDEEGRFTVSGVPEGAAFLHCRPTLPERRVLEGGRLEVGDEPELIVVGGRPEVRGRVLDSAGKPLRRYEMKIPGDMVSDGWRLVESREGAFSWPAPDRCGKEKCTLRFRTEEIHEQRFNATVDWREETVDLPPYTLEEESLWLHGTVDLGDYDTEKSPVWVLASRARYRDSVLLEHMPPATERRIVRVSHDGAFRIGPLPPRNYGYRDGSPYVGGVVYVIREGVAVGDHRLRRVDDLDIDLGTLPLPEP